MDTFSISHKSNGNFHVPHPKEALGFTGERMTSAISGQIEFEHYHRYCMARDLVVDLDVLDVAAGEGYGSALLAGVARSVVGVEIDPDTVSHARESYSADNLRYLQGDALALPLDDASVDAVVSFETLEHVSDVVRFIAEVRRVLRPGGFFMVSTPERAVYSALDRQPNPYHVVELTRPDFSHLLQDHFARSRVVAQRPMMGSVLALEDGPGWRSYERRSDELIEATNGLSRAEYLIGIASDGELPPVFSSAYIDRTSIQHALESIGRRQELEDLRERERQLVAELAAQKQVAERADRQLAQARHACEQLQAANGQQTTVANHLLNLYKDAAGRYDGLSGSHARLSALLMQEADAGSARKRSKIAAVEKLVAKIARRLLPTHASISPVMRADLELIERSGLFIPAYYRSQSPVLGGRTPLQHYYEIGGRVGLKPNPLFDSAYYLEQNDDVQTSGVNPLVHFLRIGASELRSPSREFDCRFYVEAYPDVGQARINPLVHFLRVGCQEGRKCVRGLAEPGALRRSTAAILRPLRLSTLPPLPMQVPTSPQPVVSIIIPAHGAVDVLLRCLATLTVDAPGVPFEVLVIDDATTPETAERLATAVEGVHILRSENTLGYGPACVVGARQARGNYLLFLHADTEIMPAAVDAMVARMREDETVGIVGPKLIATDGTLLQAGGIVWSDGSSVDYGRGADPSEPEFNYRRDVDYVSGAAMLVRTALLTDTSSAPASVEERDLAFRARARGFKVVYEPASLVLHCEDSATDAAARSGAGPEALDVRWSEALLRDQFAGPRFLFRARDRARNRPVILVIDHAVPEPDRDAGSRTIFSFLTMLREAGWVVKFWPKDRAYSDTYTPPLEKLGIEVLDDRWPGNLEEWLKENGNELDHLLVSRPTVAHDLMTLIRSTTSARLGFYGHDLHFLRMRRQAQVLADAAMALEADNMEKVERRLWRQFDTVIYPSQVEADLVAASAPNTRSLAVVPYHYDRFEPRDHVPKVQTVIFVAGFAHAPNIDAVMFLVNDILPIVRREFPDVQLSLVGSNPTAEVRALDGPGVEVTGWVSDERLRQYYLEARVAVVPLRFGGGVKSKVVEALAMGLPLVTTTMGAEGIVGLEDIAFVHDDAGAIAQDIIRLLRDDEEWMRMSANEIDYARRHFSREALTKALIGALEP